MTFEMDGKELEHSANIAENLGDFPINSWKNPEGFQCDNNDDLLEELTNELRSTESSVQTGRISDEQLRSEEDSAAAEFITISSQKAASGEKIINFNVSNVIPAKNCSVLIEENSSVDTVLCRDNRSQVESAPSSPSKNFCNSAGTAAEFTASPKHVTCSALTEDNELPERSVVDIQLLLDKTKIGNDECYHETELSESSSHVPSYTSSPEDPKFLTGSYKCSPEDDTSLTGSMVETDAPSNTRETPGTNHFTAPASHLPSNTSSLEDIKLPSRTAGKPTLEDDAKLVKISVPTKSINIMQSNAQFLNKGRNFLNFITEKSTNIMEKTLLPQNLAVKYNSILKLTDVTHAYDRNSTVDSCTSPEPSISGSRFGSGILPKESTAAAHLEEDSAAESPELFPRCVPNKSHSTLKSSNVQIPLDKTSCPFGEADIETPDARSTRESFVGDLNAARTERATPKYFEGHLDSGRKEILEDATSSCSIGNSCSSELRNIMPSDSEATEREKTQELFPTNETEKAMKISVEKLGQIEGGESLMSPAYLTLLREYASLKDGNEKLSEALERLEKENRRLRAEKSGEHFAAQLETLERTVEQLRVDLKLTAADRELCSRERAAAMREKESMVMKYAVSERQLIDTQRAREYAERKCKETLKEQELLQNKLKQVQGERTRICNILDSKCHELTDAQKEVEKLKEESNMREVKLKWSQSKLKTEMEAQKELQQKLDRAMARINEMKEECEQVRRESQETIRKFQQSEENKAVSLDQQLKEQRARLIMERHVTEDKEMSRQQLQKEVDLLKQRQQALIEENNTLSLKVQGLEKERLTYESTLSSLKIKSDQRQEEIVDLTAKVSQLETLKLQLKHNKQCLASNEAEMSRLRQSNEELQADMEACRQREAQMLDFTQKLTDKNVRLQSEFTSIEARAEQLELEQGPLRGRIGELAARLKATEESLGAEQRKRTEECELLARHVAEQTQLARNLAQKLEDSQGENAVIRRKRQISLREMTRELQQCRKRLEAFEAASPSNSLGPNSRTGSSTSLNAGDTLNGAVSDNSNSGDHTIQTAEPDRHTLIDRIVKLQRINVRRAEKLDFLEEHTRALVEELQKKTKIIQNYILHENFDAMGNNERDKNKAELARHGGIMASVYNQRVSDDNMTFELSLEINQKLQAVLEDTLLKNITLKDNIDTLGEEIARLTMQKKHEN